MKICPGRLQRTLASIIALAVVPPVAAQKKPVTQPLVVAALAGQTVALLPANMLIIEPTAPPEAVTGARAELLKWADSAMAETFATRAPEVKWVLPTDLRRMHRRSGGLMPDPDRLGQSVLRSWSMTVVPDPLRSNLRRLLAVADARYAFIPASLVFDADSAGNLKAELAVVLADVRTGRVVWRSIAKGHEGTAGQVLGKALATIFPTDPEAR